MAEDVLNVLAGETKLCPCQKILNAWRAYRITRYCGGNRVISTTGHFLPAVLSNARRKAFITGEERREQRKIWAALGPRSNFIPLHECHSSTDWENRWLIKDAVLRAVSESSLASAVSSQVNVTGTSLMDGHSWYREGAVVCTINQRMEIWLCRRRWLTRVVARGLHQLKGVFLIDIDFTTCQEFGIGVGQSIKEILNGGMAATRVFLLMGHPPRVQPVFTNLRVVKG